MKPLRISRLSLFGLCALAAVAGGPATGHAGAVLIDGAGGYFDVGVTSLAEARFSRVIKQEHDFSCGSAAVATLLSYHYGRATTEEEVFKSMIKNGDMEVIKKRGFSMLDMKKYLASRGLPSNGYRVPMDKLYQAKVPVIALINTNGYMHFVVVKGLKAGEVLVGDPALGTKVIPQKKFQEMWNGIAFVVLDEHQVAKRFFNQNQDWAVRAKSPLGTALIGDGLSTFTLHIPGPSFF